MKEYSYLFETGIPIIVWFIFLISSIFVYIVICVIHNSFLKRVKSIAYFLFLICMVVIILTTLVFREPYADITYNLKPFWSYQATIEGDFQFALENLLNIVLFVPYGFLVGFVTNSKKVSIAFFFGIIPSFIIEVLQLITRRGIAEFDDMFHNTLGCMIGFYLFGGIRRLINRIAEYESNITR